MPASRPAWIARITASSDSFGPQYSPPASHAPKPTTEISGPCEPSLRISTVRTPLGGIGKVALRLWRSGGERGYHTRRRGRDGLPRSCAGVRNRAGGTGDTWTGRGRSEIRSPRVLG